MSITDFVNKYNGKKVDDGAGNFRGECVSLIKRWIQENGWPMKRGNAINWQYNGNGGYQWVRNSIFAVPRPGDMCVFNVGPYGHIGIVINANGRTMQVFNQNWPSGKDIDPAQVTTFDYVHPRCIGWLRKI